MNCEKCDNTGRVYTANGFDDYETEFCACEEGQRLAFFAWFAEEKKRVVKLMSV